MFCFTKKFKTKKTQQSTGCFEEGSLHSKSKQLRNGFIEREIMNQAKF